MLLATTWYHHWNFRQRIVYRVMNVSAQLLSACTTIAFDTSFYGNATMSEFVKCLQRYLKTSLKLCERWIDNFCNIYLHVSWANIEHMKIFVKHAEKAKTSHITNTNILKHILEHTLHHKKWLFKSVWFHQCW